MKMSPGAVPCGFVRIWIGGGFRSGRVTKCSVGGGGPFGFAAFVVAAAE